MFSIFKKWRKHRMSVSKCETCKYMQKVQNSNAQLCTKNAKIVINNGILNNPCSRYEAIEENKEEDSTKEGYLKQ